MPDEQKQRTTTAEEATNTGECWVISWHGMAATVSGSCSPHNRCVMADGRRPQEGW